MRCALFAVQKSELVRAHRDPEGQRALLFAVLVLLEALQGTLDPLAFSPHNALVLTKPPLDAGQSELIRPDLRRCCVPLRVIYQLLIAPRAESTARELAARNPLEVG